MTIEQEKWARIRIDLLDDRGVILRQGSNTIVVEHQNTIDLADTIHPRLSIKVASALELLENGDYILAAKCLKEALEI